MDGSVRPGRASSRGRLLRRRPARAVAVAVAVAVVVSLAGSVAWAYLTARGAGAGAGTTATTLDATLSPATPTAELYPGGTAEVRLSVSNPNPSPVVIGSLTLDTSQGSGGYAVDAGHTGCPTSSLSFSTQSNGGSGWTVPARVGSVTGTLSITLTGSLSMSTSAANACQGATFAVYLKAGP